jgi:opacity protein-like surface antigen
MTAASRCAVMAVLAWACAAPALGQPSEHAYVQGLAGSTFGRLTDAVYGGAAGIRVADNFEVTGEIGHLRDARSEALERSLDSAEARIRASIAAQFRQAFTIDFDARAPAWYGIGGVRYLLPRIARVRPFAEGNVGMAKIEPRVRLRVNDEDLSSEVSHLVSQVSDDSHVAVGAAGGVALDLVGPLRAEVAYRYLRVLADEAIDISRIHAAVGVRF